MNDKLKKYLGVWMDENSNVLFIKEGAEDEVLVSFASGNKKAPIIREFNGHQLTTNVSGEYHSGFGELAVVFGAPYYGPQLNLLHTDSETNKEKPCLEPSYIYSVSAPKKQKEWVEKWLKPLDDFELIDKEKWKETLSLYQLNGLTSQV